MIFQISLYCVQKRTFPSLFFLWPSMGHFNLRALIFLKEVYLHYFFRLFPPLHFSLSLSEVPVTWILFLSSIVIQLFILCVCVCAGGREVGLVLSSFLGISLIYPLIFLLLSCTVVLFIPFIVSFTSAIKVFPYLKFLLVSF